MGKQPPLSPEKYITTKARSLPIEKCYVSTKWRETNMANIVVLRKHVNGNYTAGFYLVDLLCLGIKDTFYLFNVSQEQLEERIDFDRLGVEEADYNLVHNIIFAGHDFAMEFEINPHKDFRITRFILEEDNDDIPLIDIPVGDEEGNPSLLVSSFYNYAPILHKLKKHAGEGNFTFYIGEDPDTSDGDIDEDDEDDELEDEDFFDDDELDDDDFVDDENDAEYLDFNDVKEMEIEELHEIAEDPQYLLPERAIVDCELLLRQLDAVEKGTIESFETIEEKDDYKSYDKKYDQFYQEQENNREILQKVFPEIESLGRNVGNYSDEELAKAFWRMLKKYKSEDWLSYLIIRAMPLQTVLTQFQLFEDRFNRFPPSVQLFLTAHALIQNRASKPLYAFILSAPTVEGAYPPNAFIHSLHHRLFWLIKAIEAIRQDDKEKILYYHNLLSITEIGGHLKFLYASIFSQWLRNYLKIKTGDEAFAEEDNEDEDDI